jgi:hypothetical protein
VFDSNEEKKDKQNVSRWRKWRLKSSRERTSRQAEAFNNYDDDGVIK